MQPAVRPTGTFTESGRPFACETATAARRWFLAGSTTLKLMPANCCSPVGSPRRSSPGLPENIQRAAPGPPLSQKSMFATAERSTGV